ncbi:hypothetical protein JTB14_029032 [Gonioctena quinquepunctata]|nr:hypothetical protein JTB14_029032 [Gonioctena quinquepunctata]
MVIHLAHKVPGKAMKRNNPEQCVYVDVTRMNISPSRKPPEGFVTSRYNARPYNATGQYDVWRIKSYTRLTTFRKDLLSTLMIKAWYSFISVFDKPYDFSWKK